MIFRKSHWKKGASTIEYMSMIVFIIAALIVFDKYITRAFWGHWKKAGDAFGFGKQYDPRSFGAHGEGGGTQDCQWVYQDSADLFDCDFSGTCVDRECFTICTTQGLKSDLQCRNACHALTTYGTWVTQYCFDDCMIQPGSDRDDCINDCEESTFCAGTE